MPCKNIVLPTVLLFITSVGGCSRAPSSRMIESKNFKNGKFVNTVPTSTIVPGRFWEMVLKYVKGGDTLRIPSGELPVIQMDRKGFEIAPSQTPKFYWIGHATVLFEIDGKRFLTDPVFSDRVSPVTWFGPKRFMPPPITVAELPHIDAVLISHSHYDHLDHKSIVDLASKASKFYVPLGIGAILEGWGIERNKISEHDWWEESQIEDHTLIATPARHYSNRGIFNRNKTLWTSWSIVGPRHRVYFSGDTGMFPGFDEIGEKFGPFDMTMIKIGACDETWQQIHIDPEEAVQVHMMVRGKKLLPVHWGTFDLALHSWFDPAERLVKAANKTGADIVIPKVGELVTTTSESDLWWRQYEPNVQF